MDIVEYGIKLKDMMTSPLLKAANSYSAFVKNASNEAHTFQDVNTKNANSINSVKAALDKLNLYKSSIDIISPGAEKELRRYNSEIHKLESKLQKLNTMNGGKLKSWASDALSQIPGIATNPLILAGAALGKGMVGAMDKEMMQSKFGTLLGSDAAGAQMMGQIKTYADVTPYSTSKIGDAATTLMSQGVKEQDIMPNMKMLGDIALGSSDKLQSLALAFGKVTNQGYMSGQELNMLIDAGFNPLNDISAKTGISIAELRKQMEAGAISTDMVSQALATATGEGGMFYEGTQRGAETLEGKLSTLWDTLNGGLIGISSSAMPLMSGALDKIQLGLSWIIDNGDAVMAMVAGVSTALLLASIPTGILTASFWALNFAFLANPMFWVVAGIGAVVAALVYLWNHSEKTRGVLYGLWQVFKDVFLHIKDIAVNILGGIGDLIVGIFTMDWVKIQAGVVSLGKGLLDAIPVKLAYDIGTNVSTSYNNGVNKGIASSHNETKAGSLNPDDAMMPKMLSDVKTTNGMPDAYAALNTLKSGVTPASKKSGSNAKTTHSDLGQKAMSDSASIGSGGAKSIVININKSMIDGFTVQVNNLKEGANEIKEIVTKVLLETLHSANALQP